MISDEELAAIEARCAKATEGDWRISSTGYSIESTDYDMPIASAVLGAHAASPNKDAFWSAWLGNAEFIAAARTDVPRLVAEVRELRELRDNCLVILDRIGWDRTAKDAIADVIKRLSGKR